VLIDGQESYWKFGVVHTYPSGFGCSQVSSGFGMTFIGILASQFNLAKGAFKGTANGKFAVSRYFLFLEKDCHLLWSEHG
jgi:hypothetical protein